jgi:hypothetical protein
LLLLLLLSLLSLLSLLLSLLVPGLPGLWDPASGLLALSVAPPASGCDAPSKPALWWWPQKIFHILVRQIAWGKGGRCARVCLKNIYIKEARIKNHVLFGAVELIPGIGELALELNNPALLVNNQVATQRQLELEIGRG